MLVSIIIPCFNEEKVIKETYDQLSAVLADNQSLGYEFIFIDDGSVDGTRANLGSLARQDGRVRIVAFSRNFGHQPAVSAGLKYCRGDLAVIIDADLQDPPEVVPNMVEQLTRSGSSVVYGVRKRRSGETLFKLATARAFYIVLNRLSD